MADGKDGDRKRAYVKIQRNTDSFANPDTMFQKNNKQSKQKSRDCYRGLIFPSKKT